MVALFHGPLHCAYRASMFDHVHHIAEPIDPSEISAARSACILLGVAAAIAVVLSYGIYLSRSEEQHRAEERRLKEYTAVKEGRSGEATVNDGDLIAMLAADPDCVENCTSLMFTDVDFRDEGFQHLGELANVEHVGVYSSDNVDVLLTYVQGSPRIEKIWIESSPITDVGISLFTSFPGLEHLHFEQAMPIQQISYLKTALPKLRLGYMFAPTSSRREP